jgi:hypothetical protein
LKPFRRIINVVIGSHDERVGKSLKCRHELRVRSQIVTFPDLQSQRFEFSDLGRHQRNVGMTDPKDQAVGPDGL